jgi:hypothetical protein
MKYLAALMLVAACDGSSAGVSTPAPVEGGTDAGSFVDAGGSVQDAGLEADVDAQSGQTACRGYARAGAQSKSVFSFADTACDPACTDGAIFRYETKRVTDRPALDQECWQKLDNAGGPTTSWCCPRLECVRDYDAARNDACSHDTTRPYAFLCASPAEQARPAHGGCMNADQNGEHVCCAKE